MKPSPGSSRRAFSGWADRSCCGGARRGTDGLAAPLREKQQRGGATVRVQRGRVRARTEGRFGTVREGKDDLVSPSGLANCRSRSVKASINSTASKARFRRPTVVWFIYGSEPLVVDVAHDV